MATEALGPHAVEGGPAVIGMGRAGFWGRYSFLRGPRGGTDTGAYAGHTVVTGTETLTCASALGLPSEFGLP